MTVFAKTLNRRVRLLRPGGCDDLGQADPNAFALVGPAWANIRNMRGAEAVRAGAMGSAVHCSIRIRFRGDVLNGWHVECDEQKYVVRAVLPDEERRVYVDLVCEVLP